MVTLKLGGRERALRYTLKSCRQIDEVSGRGRSVLQGAIWDEEVSAAALALLLWGALLPDDPTITLEEVEDLVHPSQVREVLLAATQAWVGDAAPSEEPDTDPPQPSTPSP